MLVGVSVDVRVRLGIGVSVMVGVSVGVGVRLGFTADEDGEAVRVWLGSTVPWLHPTNNITRVSQ